MVRQRTDKDSELDAADRTMDKSIKGHAHPWIDGRMEGSHDRALGRDYKETC